MILLWEFFSPYPDAGEDVSNLFPSMPWPPAKKFQNGTLQAAAAEDVSKIEQGLDANLAQGSDGDAGQECDDRSERSAQAPSVPWLICLLQGAFNVLLYT